MLQEILLTMLIVLQMVVLTYILYTTYQKNKRDKEFWEKQIEISDEFLKQAQSLQLEGDVVCEQEVASKE